MASDVSAGMDYSGEGRRVTLMLHGEDEAELRGYWDRLSDGGTSTGSARTGSASSG